MENFLFSLSKMPYRLVPVGSGYIVENRITGRRYSKMPLPRERAEAQIRLLRIVEKNEKSV